MLRKRTVELEAMGCVGEVPSHCIQPIHAMPRQYTPFHSLHFMHAIVFRQIERLTFLDGRTHLLMAQWMHEPQSLRVQQKSR